MNTKIRQVLRKIVISLALTTLPLQVQGMQEQEKDGNLSRPLNMTTINLAERMRDWANCDYQDPKLNEINVEIIGYFGYLNNQITSMKKQWYQDLILIQNIDDPVLQKQGLSRLDCRLENITHLEGDIMHTESLYLTLNTLKARDYLGIEPCLSEFITK